MRMLTFEVAACRHTLVVHADGSAECEGEATCEADELAHEWRVGCHEVGCACTAALAA
jgi:hypothetical protein